MSSTDRNRIFKRHWGRLALVALIVLGQYAHAQEVPSRYLFIFDTSTGMKNRIKGEQLEVNQLLATAMGGQLQYGDGIGIWTFDQTLRAGQFPLVSWDPENAHDIADNINKFIHGQHYSGTTSFAALQPELNAVFKNSPRLTVIIFCDGDGTSTWTPYDEGINQMFQQHKDNETKARQPFILVMRLQLGQFVGCTMNFPPGMLNLPDFPPMPPPPQPISVTPPPQAIQAPPPTLMPLIIVGTNVMDHEPSPEQIEAMVSPTNTPPEKPTNAPPPVVTNVITITNVVSLNNKVVPPENPHYSRKSVLALGAGFMIVAIGLIALAVSRTRKIDQSSLITRSMRKD
jgi:hypothetical protein